MDIPYERFSPSPNGLTVLVHTDRKAPVVAVSVWSLRSAPRTNRAAETGFAHLFEHLMLDRPGKTRGMTLGSARGSRRDRRERHDVVRPHQSETVPTGALTAP
jgi:predicted Zn-dependent peptidase